MKHLLWGRVGVAVAAGVLLAGAGGASAAAVHIDLVPVGDVGNTADTADGNLFDPVVQRLGQVTYAYNIGKYEVTAGQYTAFLNAVGGVDTYSLYNSNMSRTNYGSGITRSGGGTVGNPYTYSVHADFVHRPVNYVSFWDACRFANWLQNGQKTGAQDATTTETGTYTLTSAGIANNTITRNTGWQWAVTSEDEWYKAAFYKGGGIDAGYWRYPTRSDTAPGYDMADPSGNNANYSVAFNGVPIDSGKYTTLVGEFQNSESPYHTYDQAGNVLEWNDKSHGFEQMANLGRGVRGGMFYSSGSWELQAGMVNVISPSSEYEYLGFRMVQTPEPASLTLLGLGAAGMMLRRRGAAK